MAKNERVSKIFSVLDAYMTTRRIEDFRSHLKYLTSVEINEIVSADESPIFLRKLLSDSPEYLEAFLTLGVNTLRIKIDDETTVLDSLCIDPERHSGAIAIASSYWSDLSAAEQNKLLEIETEQEMEEEAMDEEVAPPMPIVAAIPVPEILTLQQVEGIFPDQAVMKSTTFVNTKQFLDNIWLDAILFKTCWEALAAKGIALMPTQSSDQPIPPEQIKMLKTGGTFTYIGDIESVDVDNQFMLPKFEDRQFKTPVHAALWPICSKDHFGLLYLNLDDQLTPGALRGVFIDPFQIKSTMMTLSLILSRPPKDISGAQIARYLFTTYLNKPLSGLGIGKEGIKIITQDQLTEQNYCGDYVAADVMRIAAERIDLNTPSSIDRLRNGKLTEEAVHHIRLVGISLFGKDYYQLQLPTELDHKQVRELISGFSSYQALSGPAGEKEVAKPTSRYGRLFQSEKSTDSAESTASQRKDDQFYP